MFCIHVCDLLADNEIQMVQPGGNSTEYPVKFQLDCINLRNPSCCFICNPLFISVIVILLYSYKHKTI